MTNKLPNILFFGIDSLRSDHMSAYGYDRLTTPYIDRFAQGATLFERHYSPHIPTTSGYTNMLTGMDVFSTQVVALAHKGPLRPEIRTLPEMLRDAGYTSTCIGFTHNAASRGFDKYLEFDAGWKTWEQGRMPKADNLNQVAVPELERLAQGDQPFLLFLRHMDPHSPYLPPAPYERMFYHGNETDPNNDSLAKVMAFEPFRDYIASWLPPGCTDAEYANAQYDGAVAYMDAAIQTLFTAVERLGIADDTIIVVTSDHGETLNDHDCYYDHHGLYDPTLVVPLIIRWPGKVPAGRRIKGITRQYDTTPTLLDLIGIQPEGVQFDGQSLLPMIDGTVASQKPEIYLTECTWMRKHGWRTPEWKLIVALEPDFHYKPPVELYNLLEDPTEYNNLADSEPEVVAHLRARMDAWIEQRKAATGLPNPIDTQGAWHGGTKGPFSSSDEAYHSMHIGDPGQAQRLQARNKQ
jgi:arylsulfatase A-like enzyme